MFERHFEPVASRGVFLRRLATTTGIGFIALTVSLFAGMIGFYSIEGLEWMDSFLNAAMLLGGMGPIDHDRCLAGKLFEGIYAIYCGLAVITVAGVILSPVVHRALHKFHEHKQ